MAAALARRRASRATFLVAATFVVFGATSSGAFTTSSSCTTSSPRAASRTLCRAQRTGRPISDFSIDEVVDGRVALRTRGRALFVDVGAETFALLRGPRQFVLKLAANETLKGLRVTKIDPEKGFLDVTYDGLAEYLKDRCKPVTSFAVNDIVDGRIVKKIRKVGVFVDIGAEYDAYLQAPFSMAVKLKPNSTLKGLRVSRIDTVRSRLSVVFDQLEETIRDSFKPIGKFSVGEVVDGRMLRRTARGDVLIDIDAERSALLDSPPYLREKLRLGDMLEGVRVTKVDAEKRLLRVAFDGLEEFLMEKGRI